MLKTSLATIAAVTVLIIPHSHTHAQASPRGFTYKVDSFALEHDGEKLPIYGGTLADFRGITTWTPGSPVEPEPLDLQAGILNFYGLHATAEQPVKTYHYRIDKIYDYINSLSAEVDQPAQEPDLAVENDYAAKFTPPQNGRMLDPLATTFAVADALEKNRDQTSVVTHETLPTNALADSNNLGIKELIAEGVSNFAGSPNNRRHNIEVGVQKMAGIIVAPGDTFSFNKYLGPVDGEHGFLPELVIKKEGTIPEFGGGLCQVSSTTFRAAMAAGLPITERRNHAYAVQYYSPQGTDATIYPGVVDLKFVNDTPGHILIWPYFKDKNTLVFDFYGTKDNRQVTLDKPIQWDRKPDGSMKASWTRVVTKDGETSTSTFKSIYQPPALFHKTEEFAKPTSTPTTSTSQPAT